MRTKLHYFCILLALLALSTLNSRLSTAHAQGTSAFTYQGQLRDGGTNANGTYTMVFALYDAVTNGNLIAGPITNSPTLFNGLFSINLDFGAGAFSGNARWLDITITNGPTTQTLFPRVPVLPAPYALYAANANVAASAVNVVSGINITNAVLTNSYFSGNGAGLTNLNAARLSSNSVPSLALSGVYSNAVTFNNSTNAFVGTFTGNGASLSSTVHQLVIPVTANYTVGAGDLTGMLTSNIVYAIQSATPVTFTFPTPPAQPVQFTLLLEGTNAVTLANPGGTTFAISSGYGAVYSNSISMGGYFGKGQTWENPNATNWQMVVNSRTVQEEQNIAAAYIGVTNGNGVGLTNIPASAIVGLLFKNPVQEATTTGLPSYNYTNSNGTIGAVNPGALTIDGIAVQQNDSVLVKNEGSGASPVNGIYVCTTAGSAGVDYLLTRRSDFNLSTNIFTGETVLVLQGVTNFDSTWALTNAGPITLGTTPLSFKQIISLPVNLFTNTSAGVEFAAGVVTNSNIATNSVVKSLNGLMDNVTLVAGTNVSLFTNGNSLIIAAGVPNIQAFRSSGTFVVPTNVTRIEVEMWGGGGGGGSSSTGYSGGGGGGGGYDLGVFAVTPGSSYTVTVGSGGNAGQAGGATSFGALMTASGGSAGGNGGSSSSGAGGAGGGNSGGAVSGLVGGSGEVGDYPASSMGGVGGSTWRGGVGGSNSGPALGGNGGNSGGGSGIPGQAGNNGLVIVYY